LASRVLTAREVDGLGALASCGLSKDDEVLIAFSFKVGGRVGSAHARVLVVGSICACANAPIMETSDNALKLRASAHVLCVCDCDVPDASLC
jgi:hypothetical protein